MSAEQEIATTGCVLPPHTMEWVPLKVTPGSVVASPLSPELIWAQIQETVSRYQILGLDISQLLETDPHALEYSPQGIEVASHLLSQDSQLFQKQLSPQRVIGKFPRITTLSPIEIVPAAHGIVYIPESTKIRNMLQAAYPDSPDTRLSTLVADRLNRLSCRFKDGKILTGMLFRLLENISNSSDHRLPAAFNKQLVTQYIGNLSYQNPFTQEKVEKALKKLN